MSTSRQRKRKLCLKCNQELSHSAYVRHQNPVVCPERTSLSVCLETSSEITLNLPDEPLNDNNELPDEPLNDNAFNPSCTEETSITSSGSSSESELEDVNEWVDIFSDDDPTEELLSEESTETDGEGASREQIKLVATHICLFVSFFQLCYRISERGITLLLSFLRAILLWMSSIIPSSDILLIRDLLPKNVYFLRKLCKSDTSIKTYIVCPKCHFLYHFKDGIITH